MQYPQLPQRIVSLVPSQTELLYHLGLTDEVVGITKFCVHPTEWFRNKKRVGGTKNVNIATVRALQPDLIIANKEENTREQIEELATLYPVYISDITTIAGGLEMIRQVGNLVGKGEQGEQLALQIKQSFEGIRRTEVPLKVAYFIWRQPWMCAGGDTFISDMLQQMGWINVLAHQKRYPVVDLAELSALQPDILLLSSEPYPFKEAHIAELQAALPHTRIALADGEMFSWYGSRMLYAAEYMNRLLAEIG
jgi:ABC-type Fe3+-hydroxamate transport system substrate-binding protein